MDGQQLSDRAAAAYLEHLGVDAAPGEVDAATLTALGRAHVARVPYENIDIYRGAPPGIEPLSCVDRVIGGRGGYCFHLNGALITLLEWLQVDVTRHVSGVQGGGREAPGPNGNHLGITVRLLSTVTTVPLATISETVLGACPCAPTATTAAATSASTLWSMK